jgi:hypothetical protein
MLTVLILRVEVSALAGVFIALMVAGTSACAGPAYQVAMPTTPAMPKLGRRAWGETEHYFLQDGGLSRNLAQLKSRSTLAQLERQPDGETLFRIDEYGLLEGCRYYTPSRTCEHARLPDGSVLGGRLHWLVPAGAPATPGAGGFILQAVSPPP